MINRAGYMPIVALLQKAAFDPETTHILTTAFDKAWDKFKSSGSPLADVLSMVREPQSFPTIYAGQISPPTLSFLKLVNNLNEIFVLLPHRVQYICNIVKL